MTFMTSSVHQNQRHAFTLAEVLITLGIIGVVAAMTLPALITRTSDKESAAKLKKIFSTMSQAYMMAKNEYGTMDTWGMQGKITDENGELQYNQDDASVIITKLSPYLKTTKVCNKVKGCWYEENLKRINGEISSENFDADGKTRTSLILADGSMLSIVGISPDCSSNRGTGFLKDTCGVFAIDINGSKRPNQIGRDVFQFYFTKEGIVPYGTERETSWIFPRDCSIKNNQGWGCTAWVIYKGNMDYLYCDGLTWNGKSKCK